MMGEQQKVKGEERECGRRMRARETRSSRQTVWAILIPVDFRPLTAETLEIPRTIDVRRLLEGAHRQWNDRQAQREVTESAFTGLEPSRIKTRDPADDCKNGDQTRQVASASVEKLVGPEIVTTDPALGRIIEKKRLRETVIGIEGRQHCQ